MQQLHLLHGWLPFPPYSGGVQFEPSLLPACIYISLSVNSNKRQRAFPFLSHTAHISRDDSHMCLMTWTGQGK